MVCPWQAVPAAEASAAAGKHRPFVVERAWEEARRVMHTMDALGRTQEAQANMSPPPPGDIMSTDGFLMGPSTHQMLHMAATASHTAHEAHAAAQRLATGYCTRKL